MSVSLCLRSGSTETDTDAIDDVAIAIPPRAFPKARRAAYKSRHSDQTKDTDKYVRVFMFTKWLAKNKQ